MVGWHHWLDGHEFEQAPGVGDGQGSLASCSPWGHEESDTAEPLNWTDTVLSKYFLTEVWVDVNLASTLLPSQGDIFILPAQCDTPSSPLGMHTWCDSARDKRRSKLSWRGVCVCVCVCLRKGTHTHQASLLAQTVQNLPAMKETWVLFLCQEDPLEKEMPIHSNTFAREFHVTFVSGTQCNDLVYVYIVK